MNSSLRALTTLLPNNRAPLRIALQERRCGFWPEGAHDWHSMYLRTDSAGLVHKHSGRECDGPLFPDASTMIPCGLATSWRVGMECISLVLSFDPEGLATFARKHGVELDAKPLRESAPRYDPMVCMARAMLETELSNTPRLSDAFVDTLFGMLGLHLVRNYCEFLETPLHLAERLRSVCRQHLAEEISVERLASWIDMRPFQLQRWMKRELDTNPKKFLTDTRLQSARSLLLDSKWKLIDIALSTGFANQGHLSTVFKREYGVSPSQFRAAALGPNRDDSDSRMVGEGDVAEWADG
jgi:AraC family transcriptional regulator